MPRYASLGARTLPEISEDVVVWLAPTAGLALAAVLNISAPKPPRVRAMIGLSLFGSFTCSCNKGWFYHLYPLGSGLACWGAWSLASLRPLARGCMPDGHGHYAGLAGTGGGADTNKDVSGAAFSFSHPGCARRAVAASARVQMLDSDYGALLARAGMRQATPHIPNGSPLSLPRVPFGATSLPRSRTIRPPPSS
jgi:hypothetical protein